MKPADPVPIRISRATIAGGDVGGVVALLAGFVPGKLAAYRNRVVFHVEGSGEAGNFFGELFDRCGGILYWLEASDEGLLFFASLVCGGRREGREAVIDGADLADFLARGLRGLEEFCEAHGLDPGPTERAVTTLVKRKIGQ